jgi:hypothetical protein
MKKLTNFDKWMKHIKNIHYSDNEQMTAAYKKLTDNEEVQHTKLRSIQK